MPDGPYNFDTGSFPSFSNLRGLFRRDRRGHDDEQVGGDSAGHEIEDLEMVGEAEPQEEEYDFEYDFYNFPTGGIPNFNLFGGRGKGVSEAAPPQKEEDDDHGDLYNFPTQGRSPSQAGGKEEDLETDGQAEQEAPDFDGPYNEDFSNFPIINHLRGCRRNASASKDTTDPEPPDEDDNFDAPYNYDLGGFPSLGWLWNRNRGAARDVFVIPTPDSSQGDAPDEDGNVQFYPAKGSPEHTSGPGTTPVTWDRFKDEIADIVNLPPPTTLAQACVIKRDINDVARRLLQASSKANDGFRDGRVNHLVQLMLQDNSPRSEFGSLLKELSHLPGGIYKLEGIWEDLWKKPHGQRKVVHLARELQQ